MRNNDRDQSLEERLVALHDQDGSFRTMVDGMRALTGNAFTRRIMELAGTDPADIETMLSDHDNMVAMTAEGIRRFAALGWAPFSHMPTTGMKNALTVLADGGTMDAAEQALVDAYNEGVLSGASCVNRVQTLGYPSENYRAIFRERGRLLFKAWEHHKHGRYEASVPIIFAQIEGISYDVADKPFFSTVKGVEPIDNCTLAGMDASLVVTRTWFNERVDTTGTTGNGSRHGVLHGRELAYDTRIMSTKALVLLLAVIEWARPIAEELGQWFEADRASQWIGSTETDEDGRRHDRREFGATTKSLSYLAGCQGGWFQSRGEGFQPGHLKMVHPTFVKNGLPEEHGTVMHVSEDHRSWYAWRRTITGYVFGIGANADTHCLPHGLPTDWRWEGEEPPTGPPGVDPRWGDEAFAWPPNW